MRNIFMLAALVVTLAGCDPFLSNQNPFASHFKNFVDHDIRDVIGYYGVVSDAYDKPAEGLRVFQWKVKGPFKQPKLANDVLVAHSYEYSPFFKPQTQLPTRNAHHLQCYYNVAARYEDDKNAWNVEKVDLPAKRCR